MSDSNRAFSISTVATRKLVFLKRVTVVVLLGMVLAASCNNSGIGYRTMTVKNSIAGFSFEYRTYYRIAGPDIVDEPKFRFTYVTLVAPKREMTMVVPDASGRKLTTHLVQYDPATIKVSASDASKHPESAETRVEITLLAATKWPNFKLLERSPVTVSGVQREMIAYDTDWFGLVTRREGDEPPLQFVVQAHFDHAGLKWEIRAESQKDMTEMVKADFDHIIETFKII